MERSDYLQVVNGTLYFDFSYVLSVIYEKKRFPNIGQQITVRGNGVYKKDQNLNKYLPPVQVTVNEVVPTLSFYKEKFWFREPKL